MKVVLPDTGENKQRRFVPPPVSFERPEKKELKKSEHVVMKLRSDPADADSQTHDLTVPCFRHGAVEECLLFLRALRKVLVGQNVTTGPNQCAMARRLLEGDALAAFDRAAHQNGNETVEHFGATINSLAACVFPQRPMAIQKRHMHRF